MKKIIFIVFIILSFTKPIYASDNSNSPELLFKEMYSIINTHKINQNVVNYSIEIIKNWPESFWATKIINGYHVPLGLLNYRGASRTTPDLPQNNSRWFEKYIINNKTSEIETADIIVHCNLLLEPDEFTDYDKNLGDYFGTMMHSNKKSWIIPAPRKHYEQNFIKNESIKTLKYIENFSKNENYKILAFYALRKHYLSSESGIDHFKNFVKKYIHHSAIAEARLFYANKLLSANKTEDAINEILKVSEIYTNMNVAQYNYTYIIKCYTELAFIYFDEKDYVNAKKYINYLIKYAPSDFPYLNDLKTKLNHIEKLFK